MTPSWIMSMNVIGVLVALSVFGSLTASEYCPVMLPQDVASASCNAQREKEIIHNRNIYSLKSKRDNPFPLVDLSIPAFTAIIAKDSFMKPYATKYLSMIAEVIKIGAMKLLGGKISSMEDYAEIRQHFREKVDREIGEVCRLPSDYEPFQDNLTTWIDDEFFAQQRLAGVNPLSLQIVSIHHNEETVGLDWDELKNELNPRFDWKSAVEKALRVDTTLEEAIASRRLYALRFHLCDNLPKQHFDLTDQFRSALMRAPLSPIALFVSSSDASGSLKPVAIQMDYKPESPVYTPEDGDNWMIAKLNVQITDLANGQIVEHLARVHFVSEALCVTMKRNFPVKHPIHQIMKYHCREVMVPNVFGTPALILGFGFMASLFAMGDEGTHRLIQDAYPITGWDTTDFRGNIKKRGMQDKERIPYYPYRDDGEKIYEAIENFVREYVDHYYANDDDVKNDVGIQGLSRELRSPEGTLKPNGGDGKIKGFPSVLTVAQLQEILTRWIWQLVGQHASVNYELVDYASYVPNMPTKTYKNPWFLKNRKFDYYNLGGKFTTTTQYTFTMALSSFRYDRLLDYGHMMDDKEAGDIVNRHHSRLMSDVEAILEKRNDERLDAGQLTYPCMLPKWLPNGIQT